MGRKRRKEREGEGKRRKEKEREGKKRKEKEREGTWTNSANSFPSASEGKKTGSLAAKQMHWLRKGGREEGKETKREGERN